MEKENGQRDTAPLWFQRVGVSIELAAALRIDYDPRQMSKGAKEPTRAQQRGLKRLNVELTKEDHRALKMAAVSRDMSIRDFLVLILRREGVIGEQETEAA